MKVHITLVGGQTAPVYHTIAALRPDYIVYIYSENTQKELSRLKGEISIDSEEIKFHPTDIQKIKSETEKLCNRFVNDEVTVNISGGLKSWAYWFSIIFSNSLNATVVYIDQNNTLWNYRTESKETVPDFEILTLFRLYNNPIEGNYTDYKEYTADDEAAAKKIEEIRAFDVQQFKTLATLLSKENNHKLRNHKEGCFENPKEPASFIEWRKSNDANPKGEVTISICKKNGKTKRWNLSSPHIIDLIFNSGWFEYKVANLLSKWDKAKEIFLNCHFPLKQGVDKNEVDILVNTGAKVLFVECKTQIANPVDIDKFANVVKKYGGTGSKGLFVTDAPMSEIALRKCEDSEILNFSLQNKNAMLSVEKALAMLLDSDINSINTK